MELNRIFPAHLTDRFIEEGINRTMNNEENWEISDNQFLCNLMIDQAAEIIEVFERFLKEKRIRIPNEEKKGVCNPAILYGNDYYSMEDEIKEVLEDLLHQARSEFEEAV